MKNNSLQRYKKKLILPNNLNICKVDFTKCRNTPLSQRGVSLTIKNMKNTYFLKPAAKVLKIFETSKKYSYFVKSTLQNAQNYI